MSLCKGAPPFLFGSPWLGVSRSGPVKLHAHDCGHCSQFRTKERASLCADVQRAGRLRTGEKQASKGHPRFSDLFGCLLALGQALRVGTAMGSGLRVASPQPPAWTTLVFSAIWLPTPWVWLAGAPPGGQEAERGWGGGAGSWLPPWRAPGAGLSWAGPCSSSQGFLAILRTTTSSYQLRPQAWREDLCCAPPAVYAL